MKKLLLSCLFLFTSMLIFAQDLVIAVSDFTVESDKADYKYLGKGISRLVASELRKSGKVRLVEREAMNRVLAEQAVSLSELADETTQVRIGMMLSAKYIVVGEIIDMGAAGLLVSVRMVDVETGEVVWQDEKQEKLAVYDYMGAYFAQSLLAPLNVQASAVTVAKVEKKEEKPPEAIIKTSEGIDAYDRKDTEVARVALEEATALDPGNDVAAEYLAKLVTNTAKFKTLPEPYFPDQNPAYLGIIRVDRLYMSWTWPVLLWLTAGASGVPVLELPGGGTLADWDYRVKLGYSFPIFEDAGLDISCLWYGSERSIAGAPDSSFSYNSGLGGMLGAGFKLSDYFSLGCGSAIYAESNRGAIPFGYTPDIHLAASFYAGAVIRDADENVVYDALVGYSLGTLAFYLNNVLVNSMGLPFFVENTLTLSFNRKNTFLIFKQLNDIAFDRIFYYGRIIPAFEQVVADWFALRLGVEGSIVLSDGAVNFGYGFMGGMTFRIIPWGLDIDINVVYRLRPSVLRDGIMVTDLIGTIGVSLNDLFISRGK